MDKYQYMVIYKRKGLKQRRRIYNTLKGANKFLTLLGDTPWLYFTDDEGKYVCCDGYQCGCQGLTWKEYCIKQKNGLPSLEYIQLKKRKIFDWEDALEIANL